MIIGSIKEQNADETRVALVPSVVKKLTAGGFTVLLENGFGQKPDLPTRNIFPLEQIYAAPPEKYMPKACCCCKFGLHRPIFLPCSPQNS